MLALYGLAGCSKCKGDGKDMMGFTVLGVKE